MEYTTPFPIRLPSALHIRNELLSTSPLVRQQAALKLGKDFRIFTQETTALVSALRLDLCCVPSHLSLPTVLTMVQGMVRIVEQLERTTSSQKEHIFDECCEFYGLLQGWYAIHPAGDDFCEVLNDLLDAIQSAAIAAPVRVDIRIPKSQDGAQVRVFCQAGGAA